MVRVAAWGRSTPAKKRLRETICASRSVGETDLWGQASLAGAEFRFSRPALPRRHPVQAAQMETCSYPVPPQRWYSDASTETGKENDVRKGTIFSIGSIGAFSFSIVALAFVAGCGNQNQAPAAPAPPKWQGAAYHIAFGDAPAKPNPAGLTIPPIKFTANPNALERRVDLVVQFDTSQVKRDEPVMSKMVMAPVDISGTEGALPADYVDAASKELAKMLGAYCMKGKIKMSVALVQSTIPLEATDDQVNTKRLSDWLPIELAFKNPHPKC